VIEPSAADAANSKPVVRSDDKKLSREESTRKSTSLPDQIQPEGSIAAPRVVSLAPSNTELIYSLNAQDRLVGVSSYCLYPPETKSKQKVRLSR